MVRVWGGQPTSALPKDATTSAPSSGVVSSAAAASKTPLKLASTVSSLYDLFDMHAEARGTGRCAESARGEADTVFSLHDGITPFDADRIMSEFMTNGTDQGEVQGNVVSRAPT